MKKLLLLCVIIASQMKAQLTQANHAPANGETFETWQCDSTGVTPGGAGAGIMWDFSAVVTRSNIAKTWAVNNVSSPTYSAANVVTSYSTTDALYYNSSSGSLLFYGGDIRLGSTPLTITYTAPAIFAVYPMSINNSTSSVIAGTINALGATSSFNGNCNVVADGSGSLTLPGAVTYSNVLRVLTTQTLNVTGQVAGKLNQVEYDYYAIGRKTPLFTISHVTLNITSPLPNVSSYTIVTRDKKGGDVSAGLPALQLASAFSAFPNPAETTVNFVSATDDLESVSIFDLTGKLVTKESFRDKKVKLDVSRFNRGIYIYTATDVSGNKAYSGKITVSH